MAKGLKEFAVEYAQRINNTPNRDRNKEVQAVLNEINKLVYESTQKPITDNDKITLLEELENELKKPLIINGKMICLNEADNKNYLDLVNIVLLELQKQNSSK